MAYPLVWIAAIISPLAHAVNVPFRTERPPGRGHARDRWRPM